DERVNTIWEFHLHFDALTLFQLAENTNILFVESGATWSSLASQTKVWFEGNVREKANRNIWRAGDDDDAVHVMAVGLKKQAEVSGVKNSDQRLGIKILNHSMTLNELYMRSLNSKLQ